MDCSSCGRQNDSDAKFCGGCGTPIEYRCHRCGRPGKEGDAFCSGCGVSLRVPAGPPHKSDDRVEPERKQLTALFVDIQNSMGLLGSCDADSARALIDPVLTLMGSAVERNGGTVVKTTGDGIFATFGAPRAAEQHAVHAVIAGLEIRDLVGAASGDIDNRVVVRIGVHTGEAVVRALPISGVEHVADAVGFNVGVAARLQTAAPPGALVVSEVTHRLTREFFEFKCLGERSFKGLDKPLTLYEVLHRNTLTRRFEVSLGRGLSPWVGREDELKQLMATAQRAFEGQGQFVVLHGEPGVGKSRVLYELRQRLSDQTLVAEGFCTTGDESNSWRPIAQWVAQLLFPEAQGATDPTAAQILDRIVSIDPALGEIAPFVLFLLGKEDHGESDLAFMDPQFRRTRIFESLRRLIVRRSREHSVALILDDVQWAEFQATECLRQLGESISQIPVLVVLAARPEFRPPWLHDVCTLQSRLGPLAATAVGDLVTALVGQQPKSLVSTISDRAGGNPFFIEEILRSLIENRTLTDEPGMRLRCNPEEVGIPASVQALLAMRIDQLAPLEKRTLQLVSVLGRQFDVGLAERLSDLSAGELVSVLEALQVKGFLVERDCEVGRRFEFRHALTLETAYDSLVADSRRELHRRCAPAIEAMYGYHLSPYLPDLARHYDAAGDYRRATEFFQRAAEEAVNRFAESEAVQLLKHALVASKRLPDDREREVAEFHILTKLLGPITISIGAASQEARSIAERAYALSAKVDDPGRTFTLVRNYWNIRTTIGDINGAGPLETELFRRAEQSGAAGNMLEAHRARSETLLWQARYEESVVEADAAIAIYDPQVHHKNVFLYAEDPGIAARGFAAASLAVLGFENAANARIQEALALAPALRHPLAKAIALVLSMMSHRIRCDSAAICRIGPEVEKFCRENGIASWGAWGGILFAWGRAREHRDDSVIPSLSGTVRALEDGGIGVAIGLMMANEADAMIALKRPTEALSVVDRALATCHASGQIWIVPELMLLQAEARLLENAPKEKVISDLLAAAESAAGMNGRLFELRSVVRASELAPEEATLRQRVRQALGKLPEPADVPDVKRAKRILGFEADVPRTPATVRLEAGTIRTV